MGKKLCVDATEETGHLGRLLNRSAQKANCVPKVRVFGNSPRILLYAKRDIVEGEEFLYDYGDRRPDVVKSNRWLSKKSETVEETVFVSVDSEIVSENREGDGTTDPFGLFEDFLYDM
jgi:SET domain-containing protein